MGSFQDGNIALSWAGVFISLVMAVFLLMTSSLVVFHLYLASENLTTWESMSWMKISYMKVWPRRYGSPFFKSHRENLELYFCYKKSAKEFYQWEMPKSLPSFAEGDELANTNKLSKLLRRCFKF